jgi:hypothetical protein
MDRFVLPVLVAPSSVTIAFQWYKQKPIQKDSTDVSAITGSGNRLSAIEQWVLTEAEAVQNELHAHTSLAHRRYP